MQKDKESWISETKNNCNWKLMMQEKSQSSSVIVGFEQRIWWLITWSNRREKEDGNRSKGHFIGNVFL